MTKTKAFFAYPGNPIAIGQSVEDAIKTIPYVSSWKTLDIYGHFIADQVLKRIDDCNLFIADISVLNSLWLLIPAKYPRTRLDSSRREGPYI